MQYHNCLDALAFYKISAECRALYFQTFALARLRLATRMEEALAAGGDPASFYVISDLDETLLDNSPLRGWFIETGRDFYDTTWSEWCQSRLATGTPGAHDFLAFAHAQNVKTIYVSSRVEADRVATAETLTKSDPVLGLDFPLPDASADAAKSHLFLAGMTLVPGGPTTKKKEQFAYLQTRFGAEPLLQLGDNLSDHHPDDYDRKVRYDARITNAERDRTRWGGDWIVMPNPVYGAWKESLRVVRAGQEVPATDEYPAVPYQPMQVRPQVTPAEAAKLEIIPRWKP